jgi:hypothetical protein
MRRAPHAQRRTMRLSARGYSAPCRRHRASAGASPPRILRWRYSAARTARPEWRTRQRPPPALIGTPASAPQPSTKGAVPPAKVGGGVGTANRTQRLAQRFVAARERPGAHSGRPRQQLRMDAAEGCAMQRAQQLRAAAARRRMCLGRASIMEVGRACADAGSSGGGGLSPLLYRCTVQFVTGSVSVAGRAMRGNAAALLRRWGWVCTCTRVICTRQCASVCAGVCVRLCVPVRVGTG